MLTWKQQGSLHSTNSPPDSIPLKDSSLVMVCTPEPVLLVRAWVAKPVCRVDYGTKFRP
jgi:hypothetical protein